MVLNKAAVEALMAPLRLKYVEQIKSALSKIQAISSHLKSGQCSLEEMTELKYRAHSLSGSGATYGFDAISQKAMAVETELASGADNCDQPQLGVLLDSLIDACIHAIESDIKPIS